jgi:hypothetical protein
MLEKETIHKIAAVFSLSHSHNQPSTHRADENYVKRILKFNSIDVWTYSQSVRSEIFCTKIRKRNLVIEPGGA